MILTCMVQHIKKNRDPRWEEEFQFMLEEPPINDRMHIEVISRPSSIGLHSKVFIKSFFIMDNATQFYLI